MMPEPNYRELFIKTADKMWTDIRCGVTTIDTALDILKGILEAVNEQGERTGIKFERKPAWEWFDDVQKKIATEPKLVVKRRGKKHKW